MPASLTGRAIIYVLQQIRPANKLSDTFHTKLLKDVPQLDIPGMVHIKKALCSPFFLKEVGKLGISRSNPPGATASRLAVSASDTFQRYQFCCTDNRTICAKANCFGQVMSSPYTA